MTIEVVHDDYWRYSQDDVGKVGILSLFVMLNLFQHLSFSDPETEGHAELVSGPFQILKPKVMLNLFQYQDDYWRYSRDDGCCQDVILLVLTINVNC